MTKSSAPFPDPPAAKILLTCGDGEVTIRFPQKGVLRTFRRHLTIGIALVLLGIGLAWITPARTGPAIRWGLPAPLIAGGLCLLASAIHRGRTTTRVTAGGSGLSIENAGPFLSSRRSWARAQIVSVILSGYRSVSVTVDETSLRAPLDLSRAEARWLVTVVRSALGLRAQGARRPVLPGGTALRSSKKGDARQIVAPAEYASAVGVAMFIPALAIFWVGLWSARPDHDGSGGFALLLVVLLTHAAAAAWALLELQRRVASPVTFCVSESELVATRPRLLGRSRFAWTRDQIDDVIAGAETVLVLPKHGRPAAIRFRLETTPHDAHWVAETIRHELNLFVPTADPMQPDPER
ncbi:MAG TPA: hypothetical protein VGI81_07595 [Tepidisphaeraceae bacterium]|jgi:hypothetical protein